MTGAKAIAGIMLTLTVALAEPQRQTARRFPRLRGCCNEGHDPASPQSARPRRCRNPPSGSLP